MTTAPAAAGTDPRRARGRAAAAAVPPERFEGAGLRCPPLAGAPPESGAAAAGAGDVTVGCVAPRPRGSPPERGAACDPTVCVREPAAEGVVFTAEPPPQP